MPGRLPVAAALLLAVPVALAFYWIYQVDRGLCNGCQNCIPWCTEGAISMQGPDAWIDPELCTGCGDCQYHCPRGAIYRTWYTGTGESGLEPAVPLLSPNPASGTVSVTGLEQGQVLTVFDVTGRLVTEATAAGSWMVLEIPGDGSGLHLLAVDGVPAVVFTVIR